MVMKSNSSTDPPADFLARMAALLPPAEYADFLAAFDRPHRVGLRVNTLKISVADFINIAPFSLAPLGDWEPAGFLVTDDSRPGRHPYHDAGLYYLQEPSAMVAAALLAPSSGERVLDLAAAPGGKATGLLSRMAGPPPAGPVSALRRGLAASGLLVANDVHAGRARLLADNLARWGAVNVLVTQAEPGQLAAAFGPVFDRVLIDAPCSGEGMLRRGEPVEWSVAIVAACARRQRGILRHAPGLARPDGRLVYSTCTFAPEENEAVIADFLAHLPEFSLIEPERYEGFERGQPEWAGAPPAIADQLARTVRLWPHRFPGEGHFLAVLGRAGEVEGDRQPVAPFRRVPPAGEQLRLWREFAAASLTVGLPEDRLHSHQDRLYLLPASAIAAERVRIVRYGLPLGEMRPGRFQPAPELALTLRAGDATAALDLRPDDPRLAAYLAGVELAQPGADGWLLVTVDGFGLGWAKRVAGRLKNHYPRSWRRG
jgi:16S rRNA C967 or C1407 C5-methylase (RsmB/RsmF family)/NOL1/NOP2/fmu family ribosome biogenesis protein